MTYIKYWIDKFGSMEEYLKIIVYCGVDTFPTIQLYDKTIDSVVKNFSLVDDECFDELNELIKSNKYEIVIKGGNPKSIAHS